MFPSSNMCPLIPPAPLTSDYSATVQKSVISNSYDNFAILILTFREQGSGAHFLVPPAVLLFFVVSTVGLGLGALALWSKVDNHLHVLAALWRARGYCRIIDSLHSGCTFAAIWMLLYSAAASCCKALTWSL